jgi:hypothetical protein
MLAAKAKIVRKLPLISHSVVFFDEVLESSGLKIHRVISKPSRQENEIEEFWQ